MNPWVRPLLLLKDTPCSTNLVEEGHGSGASVSKQHNELGERSLRPRAMIHQCRALVNTSESDKRLEKLSKAVEKLEKTCFEVTHQHVFSSLYSSAAPDLGVAADFDPGVNRGHLHLKSVQAARKAFGPNLESGLHKSS